MLLWNTISLFVDAGRNDGGAGDSGDGTPGEDAGFPTTRLSSSAWEGWWHDAA
ncbi:hypothetical protein [Arthrobacter cavernae]|uniref:Uncharacterized protein n=1 Tax=Arthrobacter cavernae TaxID=2817681 RepID=A0A939HKI1_9MICC|nr:hypothetical protein [Arthrobacter cavernae]MBO1269838.1 hypothetical protein [Arthrobacter cavernae]